MVVAAPKGLFRTPLARDALLEGALLCASLDVAAVWVAALRFLDAGCVGAAVLVVDEATAATPAWLFWCCSLTEAADFPLSVVGRGLRVDDAADRGGSGGASLGTLAAVVAGRVDFLPSPSSFLSGYISKSIMSRSLSSA